MQTHHYWYWYWYWYCFSPWTKVSTWAVTLLRQLARLPNVQTAYKILQQIISGLFPYKHTVLGRTLHKTIPWHVFLKPSGLGVLDRALHFSAAVITPPPGPQEPRAKCGEPRPNLVSPNWLNCTVFHFMGHRQIHSMYPGQYISVCVATTLHWTGED